MKPLGEFTLKQWLTAQPATHFVKQLRNDVLMHIQCARKPQGYLELLAAAKQRYLELNRPDLVVSIAFEKPEIIDLQIRHLSKNVQDSCLVVADNSRTEGARQAIRQVCEHAGVLYVPLPMSRVRHANRSHSLAMQWCYENLVLQLRPDVFAFIDHDLIPAAPFSFSKKLGSQPFYGALWQSPSSSAWQLWAGYCVFRFSAVAERRLNFFYDFSNGLDTGGRNHRRLYRHFEKDRLTFAPNIRAYLPDEQMQSIQVIDDCWLHLGGAGYKQGFADRLPPFMRTLEWLEQQPDWTSGDVFVRVEEMRPKGLRGNPALPATNAG